MDTPTNQALPIAKLQTTPLAMQQSSHLDPTCPVCHYVLHNEWYFCPNCGKKLKTPPLSTSFGQQLKSYLLSLFVPPLGLIPAVKYLIQDNMNAKLVGIICLLLTILSIVGTIWLTTYLMNIINTELGHLGAPLPGLLY